MEQTPFTYWKRPYHQWVVLTTGLLQLLCLFLNLKNLNDVIRVGLMDPHYNVLQCALSGMMAGIFLGMFVVGRLSKSRRSAQIAGAVLPSLLLLVWLWVGLGLELALIPETRGIWLFLAVLIPLGILYFPWKAKNVG